MRTTAKRDHCGPRSPDSRPPESGPPDVRPSGRRPRWLAWAMILWLPLAGAACNGAGSAGGDSGADQAGAAGAAGATEDEAYPNLARVPGEVARPTPASLRDELARGLAADLANARYTGELLTGTSAAAPPAAPPQAARPQVEVIWETLRVLPEGESEAAEEEAVEEETVEDEIVSEEGASAESDTGSEPGAAADGVEEEVEINWETERVEPSGKVAMAGGDETAEELILAPSPELLAVVYFPQESAQVDGSDRARLEEVVALYKERGGRLRLVGHSDGEGGTDDQVAQRMVSLELSLERANAVAATLLDLGAEKEELLVEAKADSEPAEGAAAAGGETSDRRVEIFLEH